MPSNIFSPNFAAVLALLFLISWMIGQVIFGFLGAVLTSLFNRKPIANQAMMGFSSAAWYLCLPILVVFPFLNVTARNDRIDHFLLGFSLISVSVIFVLGIIRTGIKSQKSKSSNN